MASFYLVKTELLYHQVCGRNFSQLFTTLIRELQKHWLKQGVVHIGLDSPNDVLKLCRECEICAEDHADPPLTTTSHSEAFGPGFKYGTEYWRNRWLPTSNSH